MAQLSISEVESNHLSQMIRQETTLFQIYIISLAEQHNFNRILIKDNYYASDLLQNMLDLDASNRITLQELEEKLT